jgi:hypothetical protein
VDGGPQAVSSVEFVGAAEAMEDLRRWGDQLGPAVAKAAAPFAQRVADMVANRVPVVSGALASSVEASDEDEGAGVTLGEGLAYAGWVEFGGSRGRPLVPEGRFLYPTALEAADEFAALAADVADETARSFPWTPAA